MGDFTPGAVAITIGRFYRVCQFAIHMEARANFAVSEFVKAVINLTQVRRLRLITRSFHPLVIINNHNLDLW